MDLRIKNEKRTDTKGNPGDTQLEIGSIHENLGTTEADMRRRQQINELHAQGSTSILNFTYQDNCDQNIPAIIPFYIDDDVVNVNTVELTFRTKPFRAYSRATAGGGALVDTTESGGGTTRTTTSGGGTTATSGSGGGTSTTTQTGGQTTQTSAASGDHRHLVLGYQGEVSEPPGGQWKAFSAPRQADGGAVGALFIQGPGGPVYTEGTSGTHTHSVSVPAHNHQVTTPNHTHDVTIPNHSHEVEIPPHTHEIKLPDHEHEVKHEIVELDSMPSNVTIKVDGNLVPHESTMGDRINLVDYMTKDSNGKTSRGRHEVEILPDGLARIEADLILRVFIQSRLGEVF
jgi:hypothetical protein